MGNITEVPFALFFNADEDIFMPKIMERLKGADLQ
jgi:hypothetical protein